MSGSFYSSGKMTNDGKKELCIKPYLKLKITSLDVYVIPIELHSFWCDLFSGLLRLPKFLLHPSLTPTCSHVAVLLHMENNESFYIEYGQYLTKNSKKNSTGIFSSSSKVKSSSNPREEHNDVLYYYINDDGVRLSKFNTKREGNMNEYAKKILTELANKYYGVSYDEFEDIRTNWNNRQMYAIAYCNVKNQITLEELIHHFKGKKEWEAASYNVLTHNCQDFGAEIIKLLKATRCYDFLKVRTREKLFFPNCIIKAFWENEELSAINTIGRIPILGFLFDVGYMINEKFN